jgi:tetratricopeptide (TPR) repeat protein
MSQHKQPDPVEGIVTSDAVQSKNRLAKKVRAIVVGLLVIVLVVAAGLVYKNVVQKSKASPKPAAQSQSSTKLMYQKELTAAQSELKKADTAQQKTIANIDLGGAYSNDGQPNSAIASYQNALSTSGSDTQDEISALIGLGYAYYYNGQTAQAISTFQKVVNVGQQSSSSYINSDTATYQTVIQRLQDGKVI